MKTQNLFIAVLFANLIVAFFLLSHMYSKYNMYAPSQATQTIPQNTVSNTTPTGSNVNNASTTTTSTANNSIAPTSPQNASTATAVPAPVPASAPLMCYEILVNDPAVKAALTTSLEQQNITQAEQKTVSQILNYRVYWGLGTDKVAAQKLLNDLKTKGVFSNPNNVQLIAIKDQFALNVSTVGTKEEAQKQVAEMTEAAKTHGGTWFAEPVQNSNVFMSFNANAANMKAIEKSIPASAFKAC